MDPRKYRETKTLHGSKKWLEINRWDLPELLHKGIALWGPLVGVHASEYYWIKRSARDYNEIIIVHYVSSQHGFVGESVLRNDMQDYKEYRWAELKQKLRRLFEENWIDENRIERYLERAEELLRSRKDIDLRRTRFFLLQLTNYHDYPKIVGLDEVKSELERNLILQGRYLVPLLDEEYDLIRSKVVKKHGETIVPDYVSFTEYVAKHGGFYDEEVLDEVIAGYYKGKHILLVGPPGVGKSLLAELLAGYLGYELYKATASASWTRYDFIGGPVITGSGFRWKSGIFLKALARHMRLSSSPRKGKNGVILLLDELNRCEADKVLAEFFTIYASSDPREWRIPDSLIEEINSYDEIDDDTETVIRHGDGRIPWGFRIVATINTWDITHLYTLGYALLRRFQVVKVLPKRLDDKNIHVFRDILLVKASNIIKAYGNVDNKLLEKVVTEAINITRVFLDNGFPLGLSYVIDSVVDAYNDFRSASKQERRDISDYIDRAFARTLSSFLEPEVSRIMLPNKYLDALRKLKNNLPKEYRSIQGLVEEVAKSL